MNEKKKSVRDAWAAFKKNPETGEAGLVKALNSIKDDFAGERQQGLENSWRNNVAFYSGNQYVRDPIGSKSNYKVRIRENHTNNTISRILSIVTQNIPITKAFPASDNYQDTQNSENTEAYLKYFWRVQKVKEKISRLVKNSLIFGSAFVHRSWDPDAGDQIMLYKDETGLNSNIETMYKGDIRVDVDDPYKIFIRPGIELLDDMYDYIRSVPAARASLEEKYGEIPSEPVKTLNAYTQRVRESDDICLVHHYYHKPTPWFEEGLYACWVGTKLLKARPAKKSEKKLTLLHLPFDKMPMSFYGTSSIEQIMDLQEQLNRAASFIVEARNLVARPRVFASNEAKIAAQSLSDRPGEIQRYALAGGPPQYVVPQFNFAEMQAHKTDLRSAIGQVSGLSSASRGDLPPSIKTALALQLVLEQDRSQYAPFINSLFQVILDLSYGILYEAADNIDADDPRTIKIEGKSGDTRTFHGGMVPSPLDLYLEDTNPLGWSAGSEREQIGSLVEMGVIKDPNQVLEMLHLNSTDPVFKMEKIQRKTQEKEIELLNKGEFVEIGPEDNDSIHLDELTPVIASFEFRHKPQAVREAFLHHARLHKERFSQLQAQGMGPAPKANIEQTEQAAGQLQAGTPGDQLEELLTSARAG